MIQKMNSVSLSNFYWFRWMQFLLSYTLIQTIKLTNNRILNEGDVNPILCEIMWIYQFLHPNKGQDFFSFPYKLAS